MHPENYNLATFVDELLLHQEGGGPDHLLESDVLDDDDEVAGRGLQLLPSLLPLLPGGNCARFKVILNVAQTDCATW